MDETWRRITDELARQGKSRQWLADRMGMTIQRVQNWKSRGVPRNVYPELARALDRSMDWVAGREPAARYEEEDRRQPYIVGEQTSRWAERWPFPRVSLDSVLRLPVVEFERIQGYIEATVQTWEAAIGTDQKSNGF